jgi:transaldolase
MVTSFRTLFPQKDPPMASLLDQLKTFTVVVSDTGDINSVRKFTPRDGTTNPSLITAAAQMPEYDGLVRKALEEAKAEAKGGGAQAVVKKAIDRLSVVFGMELLQIIPGRVSTEVDARLSFDTPGTIAKARELIAAYEKEGISRQRILIKIASTWEGIQAAAQLEKEGIHCNLTLLFGLHQAIACAEAKVTLISPFVGRILDWYLKSTGKAAFAPSEDPGVLSVAKIYHYYKHHDYKTEVMGASFRNSGEILELAGCDLLTIAPKLLAELQAKEGTLVRKLDPAKAKAAPIERIAMDEGVFRRMHEQDRMANEKLAEGIAGFTKALEELEAMLSKRLSA